MTRIATAFANAKAQKRAALVTYIMGYDPDEKASLEVMKRLPEAGADIIELGMAFSDPMADGPTIQHAGTRALAAGATVKKTLALLKEFRKGNTETPVILMGYYNPVYRYGIEAFVKDAVKAGADGMILVDLPPEEEEEFTEVAIPAGLALIKLTAPTTDEKRAKVVFRNASGFVYYISVAGVTGGKSAKASDIKKRVAALKKVTKLPIVAGFGISTPEQAAEVAKAADGVVVGSALVKLIGAGKSAEALKLVKAIRKALSS